MIANAESTQSASRLRSVRGRGAGAWIQAIPSPNEFALSPCEFRIATCLRLGLALPFQHWVSICNCGTTVDDLGFHLLTCKRGGGPIWAHDSVTAVWSDCLRQLGVHHKKEPRNRYLEMDRRPDIAVFDSGSLSNEELDISLAHPWNQAVVDIGAKRDGFAAKRREENKMSKYSESHLPNGLTPSMIPLVFEHFGTWGEKANNFLKTLSKRSIADNGGKNPSEFKTYWRRRFAVMLQKVNGRVILKKLDGLLCDSNVLASVGWGAQCHVH